MITDLALLANRPDAVSLWLDEHPVALGLILVAIGMLFVAVGLTRYRGVGLPDAPEGTRSFSSYGRIVSGLGFIGVGIYWIVKNWG